MKYILALLFTVCAAVLCPAQRQTGYVKTPGRLGPGGELIAGQRISGATLYLRDISTVSSGPDGTFTLAVPGKSFMLTRVQKNGYELADRDLLGKTHSTSSDPFIVVMDTPDALLAQRLSSERKLRRTLQQQLQAREDEIEALREQQRITEDEYHKKLQELYASQENNEKLIADMAERYARMDFDRMDDFRRRVAACIQSGDLTRADSLLSTKGSMEERIAELSRMDDAIRDDADDLARRQEAHNKSVALRAKTLEDIAADCYNRSEICLMEHKNDSAAYYLELRANTDTLNAEWQMVASHILNKFVGSYTRALQYENRALRFFLSQPEKYKKEIGLCYYSIGQIERTLGDLDSATDHFQLAQDYFMEEYGEDSVEVANVYNSFADICQLRGDYEKALIYLEKDLEISLRRLGENHNYIAITYKDLGDLYSTLGNYNKALEFYKKSLSVYQNIDTKDDIGASNTYNSLGLLYTHKGEYDKSIECHNRALAIELEFFDESHPEVVLTYSNIGLNYHYIGDYPKALEYYNKSLQSNIKAKGNRHPSVAIALNNIGGVYLYQGDYDMALSYFNRALEIQLACYGDNHMDVARSYHNIGSTYLRKGEYIEAIKFNEDSRRLYTLIFDENYPDLHAIYSDLMYAYAGMDKYVEALKYCESCLKIRLSLFDVDDPGVSTLYGNMAGIYWAAKSKGDKLPGYDDFMSGLVFFGTVIPGETNAAQQGMTGEYIALEFGDWTADSDINLMGKIEEFRGKPKTIVVMQDGKITRHQFEDTIGMTFSYKHVGRAERQRIIDEYRKWKARTL